MKLLFKQRFFSWFDSYDIYYENGQVAFTVEGKPSWGHELHVYDSSGMLKAVLKEKLFRFFEPTFDLNLQGGCSMQIKKELTFFRPSFVVEPIGWTVEGDFWQWDYVVKSQNGAQVASMSKELFNFTDTYSIDVADPTDALIALCLTLTIDAVKCSEGN